MRVDDGFPPSRSGAHREHVFHVRPDPRGERGYCQDMPGRPTAASTWFIRCSVVLACAAATLVGGGSTLGATPIRHAAQAPVCSSAGGEQVCIQGWRTGITFTFSGSSTDADGHVFQDGAAFWGHIGDGAKPVGHGYIQVNWHGTGTLFVPLPEGQWVGAGAVDGGDQGPPATSGIPAIIDVGPSEPPPPTTCSTVAQGTTPLTTGQLRPWVSVSRQPRTEPVPATGSHRRPER